MSDLQRLFVEVNGDHPMTPLDDAYVRMTFREPTGAEVEHMLARRLPLPAYFLSDGTPMVHRDHSMLLEWQGDALEDWFRAHWPDEPEVADRAWRDYLDGRHPFLKAVSPRTIRRMARAIETIRAHTPVIEHDVVARGAIGEAVDGLDHLLLPLCDHDRLRLGGPTPRETWIDDVRRDHLAPPPLELPLRTERLVLRAFTPDDGHAMLEYAGDAERQRYVPMPVSNEAEQTDRARERGRWAAEVATGAPLLLAMELGGRVIGDLMLRLDGPALAMAEIGWMIHVEFEGRGLVTEGARELLRVAFEDWHLHRVFAELDARNGASAAVCERLGMRRELDARADYWMKGEWTPTSRYAILSDEWSGHRSRG